MYVIMQIKLCIFYIFMWFAITEGNVQGDFIAIFNEFVILKIKIDL